MSDANSPTSRRGRPPKRRLDTDAGAGPDAGSVVSGERTGDPAENLDRSGASTSGTLPTTAAAPRYTERDIEELARFFARTDHRKRSEIRQRAIAALERGENPARASSTPGASASPDSAAPDSQPAETPANPTFTTENVGGARRGRKPKLDLETTNIISSNFKLMVEALASAAAGAPLELTENETQLIVLPASRILQRLQPDTVKAIGTLSDPIAVVFGSIMLISRIQSVRRDNDDRRRPPPAPPPATPPPSGATVQNQDEQIAGDGHLQEVPIVFTDTSYRGVEI